MTWTKADLRRVQDSLGLFAVIIRERGIRRGMEREADAFARTNVVRFVVSNLRDKANDHPDHREGRAAARLAERVEREGLPEGVTLPRFSVDDEPVEEGALRTVQRVLLAAAESVEPPRGIVALDLRGLGFRCVRALVEALVDGARRRAAGGALPRGAVLVADSYPASVLGRLVDLCVE